MKIDYLVLENYIIDARDIDKTIREKLILERETKIQNNERKAIDLLTSNYNDVDKKNYFKIEEKKAYWSAIEKPINDLENTTYLFKNNDE